MEWSSCLGTGKWVNKDRKWMCHVVRGAQCKFDLGALISLRIYPEMLEAKEAGPNGAFLRHSWGKSSINFCGIKKGVWAAKGCSWGGAGVLGKARTNSGNWKRRL